jgi:hypothetical protein
VQYNPWFYGSALKSELGALNNGAPFKETNSPASIASLRERFARHPDARRRFV